ncbi:hypothetical protein LIER_16854 [Lithospermum erythrorhizon]|uniref:BHLH domain-containing protein n=1 Tax=Lithospermum erythrorhizon TaxID=34254 RepID=A0AAV3QAN7_LITER
MSNIYHSTHATHQVEPLDRDFSVQFDPNFLLQKTTTQPLANDYPLVISRPNGSSPQIEEAARVHNRGLHELLEHAQTSSMITSVTSRGGKSMRKENNKNNMRSGKPRSQGAHTMSERRRRENIRSKMKAMHQLLPHCDTTRNVEILDRAIEYIEELQRHIQIIQEASLRQKLQGNMGTDDSLQIGTKRGLWPPGFQMVPPPSSFWGRVHRPSLLAATTFPGELGPGIVTQADHQVPITPFVVPGCFWGMYGIAVPQSTSNALNPSQLQQQVSGGEYGI